MLKEHYLTEQTLVVVGGGTAGLAIASRLSEFASVAVLEAGGRYEQDNGNQSVVPYHGLIMPVLGTSEAYPPQSLIDWDLLSTAQSAAGNRRIHYAQGKTLGGSSAINTMAYHRATAGSYQRWADLVGDQSYTYDKVLPYFKKSATITPLTSQNAMRRMRRCDTTTQRLTTLSKALSKYRGLIGLIQPRVGS